MTDDDNKISVFGSDDDLKSLGELLSNETSRKIIKNLMEHQMYTNEIATKLDMRVSLVIHHLKKMEALGLLEITDKKIKRKGEKHRFFKMNSDIFVTLDKTKEEVKENGILKKFFKDGLKFTSISIVGVISWFSMNFISNFTNNTQSNIAVSKPLIESLQDSGIIPILISQIFVILLTVYIIKKKKKNRKSIFLI